MKGLKIKSTGALPEVKVTASGKVSMKLNTQLVHMLAECLDEYVCTIPTKAILTTPRAGVDRVLAMTALELYHQHFHGRLVRVKTSYTIRLSEAFALWTLSQTQPGVFLINAQMIYFFGALHQKLS